MTPEPLDETKIGEYLTAFADGELDPEQSVKVQQYMAVNPGAARRALGQQQLRRAAAHVT